MRKLIVTVLCCLFSLLLLVGCANEAILKTLPYSKTVNENLPDGEVLAENSKMRMIWNRFNGSVILEDIKTGKKWGTTPISADGVQYDEFGMPIKRHPQIESVLKITYVDTTTGNEQTSLSYTGSVASGNINCTKTDNGVEVEYYFNDIKIMVPIKYTLLENGINLSVDANKIQEEQNQVVQISLAPFMTSVKNDTADSYLFYPSGSGAIILPETISQTGTTYRSSVYGEDPAVSISDLTVTTQNVALPVYGVKEGENALFSVIDGSAESAIVETIVGSTSLGYSSVYATFQVRGYYNHIATVYKWSAVHKKVYAEKINTVMSASFYPLFGENANYSGMAKFYQELLINEENMSSECEDVLLNCTFIGGSMINKSFLGIPYTKLYATTSLKEATNMVNKLSDKLGNNLSIRLKGYGESGIDISKIAGGFKISKELGGTDGFNSFSDLCKEKGLQLYTEFELARFRKSANGYNSYFDAADNAGQKKAYQYIYHVALRTKGMKNLLLGREQLVASADKLLKKTDSLMVDGIDIASLASVAYSDYGDKTSSNYYSKSHMADDVKSVIVKLKSAGKKISSENANVYAAANSDIVLGAPTASDRADIFEYDVPFYSMVFKGCVPITTQALNSSANYNKLVLQAVESGCSLNYNLISKWDNTLIESQYPLFFASKFDGVYDQIIDTASSLSEYYQSISGQKIVAHNILENGLRQTVFENGIKVYVNYSDKELVAPSGAVAANGYLVEVQK